MRPLFDDTSGHAGFVQGHGCFLNACHNEEAPDPENLGNDVLDFILSHTAQELEELKEMIQKVTVHLQTLTCS